MTTRPDYLSIAFRVKILEKSLTSAIDALRRVERGEEPAAEIKSVADACAAILDRNWMDAKEARQEIETRYYRALRNRPDTLKDI